MLLDALCFYSSIRDAGQGGTGLVVEGGAGQTSGNCHRLDSASLSGQLKTLCPSLKPSATTGHK